MNKKLLKELKEKLEKQKTSLETDLSRFAQRDEKLKGDWDTKFPQADGAVGGQVLEDAADQVEHYVNLLPVEHNMEVRLQKINSALVKIKKGSYGTCEKCGKKISEEKLRIYPESTECGKCKK